MKKFWGLCAHFGLTALVAIRFTAADDATIDLTVTNGLNLLDLPLVSGVDEFRILTSTNVSLPFLQTSNGSVSGYLWSAPGFSSSSQFFTVQMVPKSSNEVVNATLLNRLAYGPTPDEIERLNTIGPEAYIQEQLAPENIDETLPFDVVTPPDQWQYVTHTGPATTSTFYIYSTGVGDFYVDNIKLVAGTVPEAGPNLLPNGDFENGLNGWTVSTNLTGSDVTSDVRHDGNYSLHVISLSGTTTTNQSIFRSDLTIKTNTTNTLSFWFKPGTNISGPVYLRLSGASPSSGTGIYGSPGTLATTLANSIGTLNALEAWHTLHAVQSKKQLLEVLLQFCDNHFVTQESKSRDYMDRFYDTAEDDGQASNLEFREVNRWRQALQNPQCTFYDLLKISAESPAMIIYLDTVDSRGNGKNIANENYARELLELFDFGVDNGYDQNDITVMSRAWSGWTLRYVDKTNEFNPFATNAFTLRPGGTNNVKPNLPPTPPNTVGIWAFNYDYTRHNASNKVIFPGKTVPARFGAPYAGRNYELDLPARTGTNSIQDGYDVIAHLANQPFTQEFISVKLCRVFVHDDFATGYDFTDPNLSPEGQLVRACMDAWEQNEPKGQIRKVLNVIFHSDLFRSQGASMQKVKTPFEYTVSAIRALRVKAPDGTWTDDTDGYSLRAPMSRMGGMQLFNRDTPDGYPEAAAPWISAGTLTERLRFVQSLLIPAGGSGKSDSGNLNTSDPVKLLKFKLPQSAWRDANAVASYFLGVLFPGEGKANLNQYLFQAVSYLNTADDGTTASPFSALVDTTTTYDYRVRGMVAMLMTFPRFQEQ